MSNYIDLEPHNMDAFDREGLDNWIDKGHFKEEFDKVAALSNIGNVKIILIPINKVNQ